MHEPQNIGRPHKNRFPRQYTHDSTILRQHQQNNAIGAQKLDDDAIKRALIRIETKVTRGFEALGVGVSKDVNWLRVDNERCEVYLTTLAHSIKTVLAEMARCGANKRGAEYELIYRDGTVGWIVFDDTNLD